MRRLHGDKLVTMPTGPTLRPRRLTRSWRYRRGLSSIVTGLVLALVPVLVAASCSASGPSAAAPSGSLTVDLSHPGTLLPANFLGLSFEASVLHSPLWDPGRTNLAALLTNLGAGPLRFGGNSLDRLVAWTPDPKAPLPSWARTRVTPDDLARLGRLTAATGWRVDLGIGLGHPDPDGAAGEAAAASRLLGGGLEAVQIGNEPDLFAGDRSLEPGGFGFAEYVAEVGAYRRAIDAAVPGLPLGGPDTATTAWLAAYGREEGEGLLFLAEHFYPLTRCDGARPTIGNLLSTTTADRERQLADATLNAGRADGVPVRLDEFNSASCGGQDGVSNTLASALWMTRALLLAGQSGVAGVDVHGGLAACRGYSPLCVPGATGASDATAPGIDPVADRSLGAGPSDTTRLAVQPDYYGLLVVHLLEGGRFLSTRATTPSPVDAFGVVLPDGAVRLVLDDTDLRQGADVLIQGPRGAASVLRLTGPSAAATSGVRLGGAAVGPDGTWRPDHVERIGPTNGQPGGVRIAIAAASAAVVTFSPQ